MRLESKLAFFLFGFPENINKYNIILPGTKRRRECGYYYYYYYYGSGRVRRGRGRGWLNCNKCWKRGWNCNFEPFFFFLFFPAAIGMSARDSITCGPFWNLGVCSGVSHPMVVRCSRHGIPTPHI